MRLPSASLLVGFFIAAAPLAAQGVRINLVGWPEPVLLDSMRIDHDLRAIPASVYQAVQKAFADLDIPVGNSDGKVGIIGSERFERLHTFAGAPLSRTFSCGEGATGPNADTFRLEIAVVAWVTPQGTGSRLGFATIATGRDISGISRAPKVCQSTGWLENKLFDRVSRLIGG